MQSKQNLENPENSFDAIHKGGILSKKLNNQIAFIINQKASFLTSTDKAVINYISSFTHDARKRQKDIAIDLGLSIRTFQRSIDRLLSFGLIRRKYGYFKRVKYMLVSIADQIMIVKNILANGVQTATNFVDKMRDKIKKRSTKSSDMSRMSDLITTLVPQSTKENTFKENKLNKDEKKESFEDRKERFLRQLQAMKL